MLKKKDIVRTLFLSCFLSVFSWFIFYGAKGLIVRKALYRKGFQALRLRVMLPEHAGCPVDSPPDSPWDSPWDSPRDSPRTIHRTVHRTVRVTSYKSNIPHLYRKKLVTPSSFFTFLLCPPDSPRDSPPDAAPLPLYI